LIKLSFLGLGFHSLVGVGGSKKLHGRRRGRKSSTNTNLSSIKTTSFYETRGCTYIVTLIYINNDKIQDGKDDGCASRFNLSEEICMFGFPPRTKNVEISLVSIVDFE